MTKEMKILMVGGVMTVCISVGTALIGSFTSSFTANADFREFKGEISTSLKSIDVTLKDVKTEIRDINASLRQRETLLGSEPQI